MAADLLIKTNKQAKYNISYRKILYHRFFVGLLLFIVISLVFTIVYVFSGSAPRTNFYEAVNLEALNLPIKKLANEYPFSVARVINCTYWNCFNVYRCGRGGHDKTTIYIYPLQDYRTEDGKAVSHFSREFFEILETIKNSRYYTSNPDEACLLVPSIDILNQNRFSSSHISQVLQSLK